ncbi:MAG: glycosyltransferase [Sphingomonadales bacterium]
MKIAYIYLGAGANESSVQRKIKAQIKALNAQGCSTTGIFFTAEATVPAEQEQIQWKLVRVPQKGWFQSLKERKSMTRVLYWWAAENAANFDKVYVRNYRPTLWWYLFIRRHRERVIVEHQTKEIDELMALWNTNKFGCRPSLFLSWIEHNIIPFLQEKIYGSLANGTVKTLVAVTSEIATYESKRAFFAKPQAFVIGNGIQTKEFPMVNRPIFEGTELNLLMLVGGTTETDWHGVDLILESIGQYDGNCKVKLWVAGSLSEHLRNHPNIKYLGFCDRDQLNEIFNNVHLAMGSFALQRKGLFEASTLKVREYMARGIPAVIGHIDADLPDFIDSGFILPMNADKVPSIETIIKFAHQCSNKTSLGEEIRNMCFEKLDYSVKANALTQVFLA